MSGPPHLLLCVQFLGPGDDAANRGQVFPVVLNTGCVILDKLFTLSGSHFPNSEWMCKIIGMSEKTPGLGYKGREKKEESEMQAEGTACAKVLWQQEAELGSERCARTVEVPELGVWAAPHCAFPPERLKVRWP